MSNRLFSSVFVLIMFGPICFYVLQSGRKVDTWYYLQPVSYVTNDNSSQVRDMTSDKASEVREMRQRTQDDLVISALRDAMPYNGSNNCRDLFTKQTSAYNFSMSEDFRANINEFLSTTDALNANVRRYRFESQYTFFHYLPSNLKFVHTVCETGMTTSTTEVDT